MLQLSIPHPESFIVICPLCFDVWARLKGESDQFWHRYVCCPGHIQRSWGNRVPGSLLEAEPELLDLLSTEYLQREFEAYCSVTADLS